MLALSALAVALAIVPPGRAARAQSAGTSLFQPSLSDPYRLQRFRTANPTTRIQATEIVPPSGAGETGFDSTGAITKKRKARRKPGEPRPLPPPPPPPPGPPQAAGGHINAPQIAARAPYADVYKPPDAPLRRPLVPFQDAFEPVGLRVGSFVLKPAIDVSRGYDTNPSHVPSGRASAFTVVEPSLKVQSNWARHEAGLDLRGSYSSYDSQSSLNRPLVDAKGHARFDLTRDTAINTEARYFLSTDYPGSPNLPADIARLPVFQTYGGTAGLSQRFNRLELSGRASVDRTTYEDSDLTNGATFSNKDRDYNQYGGAVRAGYDLIPGMKPFAEVGGDTRQHDLQFDRNGYQRDSRSLTGKVGSTFDIARKLTGEASVGYSVRQYEDPRLQDLRGAIFDAALRWQATGLTTATLTASSRGEEVVVAGWSGAKRRDVGVQIDHAFRRWLIGTIRAGYGFDEYVGSDREDKRLSLGAAITYKLNRYFALKGEYRYDQLRSTASGVDYTANVVLVGLKLQR